MKIHILDLSRDMGYQIQALEIMEKEGLLTSEVKTKMVGLAREIRQFWDETLTVRGTDIEV